MFHLSTFKRLLQRGLRISVKLKFQTMRSLFLFTLFAVLAATATSESKNYEELKAELSDISVQNIEDQEGLNDINVQNNEGQEGLNVRQNQGPLILVGLNLLYPGN